MDAHVIPSAHPLVEALRREFPEWWCSVEESGGGMLLVARIPQCPFAGESPVNRHPEVGQTVATSAAESQWCLAPLQSCSDAKEANWLAVRP
jgi:hypothetical protein